MKKQTNGGYSLVEVLIAIAITGVVLLTVVTLFYMGRRNVYSGKQMTYAVSVGTRIMEDLSTMTSDDVLTNFGITDTTARQSVVVCNNKMLPLGTTTCTSITTTFLLSTARDSSAICTGCDPNGFLASWNGLVDQTKLTNAKVGLILTPRNPAVGGSPWTTARFTRIRAFIQWEEAANRTRIAFFDTTKVNRE